MPGPPEAQPEPATGAGRAEVAATLRTLGRQVAHQLTPDATPGEMVGWPLWKDIIVTGNTEPKTSSGAGAAFGWWHYLFELSLCTDGEFVGLITHEGSMESPNYGGGSSVPATDEELLYPDVVRWNVHRNVDEAPARFMIDEYRVPAEFRQALGETVRRALDAIATVARSPENLLKPEPATAERRSGSALGRLLRRGR
jgi:hypothetical protein